MRPDNRTRLLAAAVLVFALQACGDSGEQSPPPAPPEPAAAPAPSPAATPAPAPAPGGAGDAGATPGDATTGGTMYAIYCASCHGPTGNADTPIADTLDPRPTPHANGAYMNTLSDDYLFRIIKGGGTAVGKAPIMPPWAGSLSDAQIRDVMAFVRTLARPPYQPPTS
jgi:mono/diheme cytochrome c family protein